VAPRPAAGDWPQFRGPGGSGISQSKGVPLTWSATQNLAWKAELPGAGSSSPIVVGDRVFVTAYSGYGVPEQESSDISKLTRHLLCLNLADGKLVWQKDLPAALPEQDKVREHGYAASTPATDGERLYVFFGKSGVFAFDLNGQQLWQASVGSKAHGWGSAASPVLYKDLVIINASVESECLVALNKLTGREVWRATGMKESWNTPLFVTVEGGKTELVVAIFGKLLGFDPASGEQLWSCDTDIGWYMVPSLVAHEGSVYCIGGRSGGALAVRAGGRGDVTQFHRLWTGRKGSNVSSPVLHDGRLYFANEGNNKVHCIDAQTGKEAGERQLVPSPGTIYASPLLADGKLYVTSRGGRTYVLSADPRLEQLAVNDLKDGSIFDGSPAVAGGRLLLRSYRHLYCVGSQ
jgi:outer membrane protein assembly factor BamB